MWLYADDIVARSELTVKSYNAYAKDIWSKTEDNPRGILCNQKSQLEYSGKEGSWTGITTVLTTPFVL